MTEEVQDAAETVSPAEAFRAAALEARKVLEAGTLDGAAPSDESGSSPAIGAESVVPETATPADDGAKPQDQLPEAERPEGVVIDPEAAWSEYKTDEDRKKALAHNKAYAAEMAKKARELEAKLAEATKVVEPKKEEPTPVPEVTEEQEAPYEDWVKTALNEPKTDEQKRIARLATEYNQFLAEKVTPAEQLIQEREAKVRELAEIVKSKEAALTFLQSRKDQEVFLDDIKEVKDAILATKIDLVQADNARLEAVNTLQRMQTDREIRLGVLKRDVTAAHATEVNTRKDSVSKVKAQEESKRAQEEVDKAWELAKAEAVKSRGDIGEAQKEFLLNAADGAMVRTVRSSKPIPVDEYQKFIEDSWKPFQLTAEKARQDAVKKAIDVVAEPTPAKATSDKPNLDAQPISYDDFKRRARALLAKSA